MNRGYVPINGQSRLVPAVLCALVVIGLALIGAMEYLGVVSLTANAPLKQLFSYKLISYANLLLIGSTILYVAHLWFTAPAVGLWATGTAAVGALGLVAGLVARATEHHTGQIPLIGLSEVMSLFIAMTVVIYLAMERAYRTRSAGAFVMPIVAIAVLFEAWLVSDYLVSPGNRLPLLRSYLIHIYVLANLLAYSAFAVAAAVGVMYLLRQHVETHPLAPGFALRERLGLAPIARLLHLAIFLGFAVFSCATLLGIALAHEAGEPFWAWDAKKTAALLVWIWYFGYFYLHYGKKWRGMRMAWWAILGFALTVYGFLGLNLFLPVLHAYG